MSKFNHRSLAVCVAAALSLPAVAMAATAGYPAGTNSTYASNILQNASATLTSPAQYTITTQASDNIIGRTTGFGVRLILGNGVNFTAATTNAAAGAALTGYNPVVNLQAVSTNTAVYSVVPQPGAPSVNVGVGALVNFPAGSITVTNLGALANGGSVPVTIELFDSNTAQVFQTIQGAALINAVEGTTVTFTPSAGDVNKRIDVAACASPAVAAKTQFSPNGDVGGSCGAAGNNYFNAGQVVFGITQVGGSYVLANGFAGPNNSGNPGNGNFWYAGNDEITFTVSGTDFSAFDEAAAGADRIWFSTSPTCATANFVMTVNGAKTAASFTGTNGGSFYDSAPFYVCFFAQPARLLEIAAQPLTLTFGVNFIDNNVRDPADRTGSLLPLQYNGTVLQFQNVNPGSNPRAQSFLRFTNNSGINCPVTLRGRDDNAEYGDSTVNFVLGTGQSQTFNSDDLESGSSKGTGAFGDGAGRWYVTATAECGSFVGSALNRNLEDGTVTNLTPQNHGQGL